MGRSKLAKLLSMAVMALLSSCAHEESPGDSEEETVLRVDLPQGHKTTLGPSIDGRRKVYWTDGDRLSLSGLEAVPLRERRSPSVQ